MASLDSCPVCLNSCFELLIDFGLLPRSGTFLSGAGDPYKKNYLSFKFCPECALIRRVFRKEDLLDYAQKNRTTSHCLPDYAEEIVKLLQNKGFDNSTFIMEIGANDGAFMDLLRRAGFSNQLAVEPSSFCASLCLSKGYKVEAVTLNENEAVRIRQQYGKARAIICRHTLEHVPDPFGFLLALRILLRDDGCLFIEVPDAHRIIRDMRGYELWDEHLYSFTSDNLRLLLQRAGFKVDVMFSGKYHGTENILLFCSPDLSEDKNTRAEIILSSDVRFCRTFAARWRALAIRFLEGISDCPRPIICMGASHGQSNFLLFTGLSRFITAFVDDDSVKKGCFVPLEQPVCVISTEQLVDSFHQGTLLYAVSGCEDWVDKICEALQTKGKVNIFDPFKELSAVGRAAGETDAKACRRLTRIS